MEFTLVGILNLISIVVILTISFIHLFIYFGRKKDKYNLFFSLSGFSTALFIYFLYFMPLSEINLLLINYSVVFVYIFIIKTINIIIQFNKANRFINKLSILLNIINAIITTPIIFLGINWFRKYIYIPGMILVFLSLILLSGNVSIFLLNYKFRNDKIMSCAKKNVINHIENYCFVEKSDINNKKLSSS